MGENAPLVCDKIGLLGLRAAASMMCDLVIYPRVKSKWVPTQKLTDMWCIRERLDGVTCKPVPRVGDVLCDRLTQCDVAAGRACCSACMAAA